MQSSTPEFVTSETSSEFEAAVYRTPFQDFRFHFQKNRGAVVGMFLIVVFVIVAVFAPWIAPYSPEEMFADALRIPPKFLEGGNSNYLLGTDDVGRDTLSRLIYGARVSLGVGFFTVVLATGIGTFLGLVAGYFGGWIDKLIMRSMDVLLALPSILLAVVVITILGPGITNAVLAVSIVAVPGFVRVVRSSVLTEKSKPYVTASRTFGAGNFKIIFSHILPNCMAPLTVQATLSFSDGILNVAALGFLGLGAQPPMPEWGTMLSDSKAFLESSPWMVTLPGLCILVVVLAFNLLGDGVRDAFDPRLKSE